MIIHVRNFGKIAKADINLSDLVVFVGENNSGKTYLMQLIYGVFSYFYQITSSKLDTILLKTFSQRKDSDGQIVIKANDTEFYRSFQDALNASIDENKTYIIERIFHTNTVSVDSISVEFTPLSCDYSVTYYETVEKTKAVFRRYAVNRDDNRLYSIGFGETMTEEFVDILKSQELLSVILSELTGMFFNKNNRRRNGTPYIYFPASRSGLMLLYANYLSNDEKNQNNVIPDYAIEQDDSDNTDNEYGLTEPVYNFLMFLLKHKYSEMVAEQNKDLIAFIDNNIINGHMEKVGSTMLYIPENSNQLLPIKLSSSLVSEIAPLYQTLSGIQHFNYILYDEIETCQHPTKQLQLARLLIRMVNSGYKLIVSTHSDTMATAINNLITLSFKNHKIELLKKLEYNEDDILKSNNVKAYQFIIGKDGKTTVVEAKSNFSLGIGFDFDLFNATNQKIFNDAVALAEVE